MSSMVSNFVLSFFPLDILDEIWDCIESVPENFLTYSHRYMKLDQLAAGDHAYSS